MVARLDALICAGAACISSNSLEVKKALEEALNKNNLLDEVRIIETGCMGPCELGPVMLVYPEGSFYIKLTKDCINEIVSEHFLKGRPVEKYIWQSPEAKKIVEEKKKVPFFEKQLKIVLGLCGKIDPENIEEYIGSGGYEALGRALTEIPPEKVIEEVKNSGLKGRGGAGFLTGLKWQFVKAAQGAPKYVVCNGDEGDPGAFMDRAVLEGDPHTVVEGMAIAGYAVGANKGYAYVRAEYPLAIKRFQKALEDARKYGLLGNNILETGFNFDIEIRVGAGAFVCGEETALLASIEGKRGHPRPKPPFPANSGLWGKPTLINNVETYANIRHIIINGSKWFSSIGTEKSKGTKVFALSGKVRNTGLVEVPMGIPLGDIVFDVGGGIPKEKKFKAVQSGGPSGGCIPAEHLNTLIDYETLKSLGSIMGSGGLIVLDEDNCMVNMAKFFLEFTVEESCGKCPSCRIGLKSMLEILDKIVSGHGEMNDLDRLEALGKQIQLTSLCGLGQTAPNPVLSTIRYFKDEYIAHIVEKKCSASVCASLFHAPCQNACPAGVDAARYIAHLINGDLDKAFWVHMESNPFPSICARVCPAFCETKCRRGQLDAPVSIREIKRSFADWSINKGYGFMPPKNPKSKKVAIIGAGPAGLSCGFYLTRLGYKPVVFEASSKAGGMMAVCIPDYRLPKEQLQSEINRIQAAGVEIKYNSPVKSVSELFKQGFDAVFIGTGAHRAKKLGVEGEEKKGVISGIEFLRRLSFGEQVNIGSKVVVVGGGSTAMDAARSALRMGAKEVRVIYRRTREEMPAQKEEIRDAIEEGIQIDYLVSPVKVMGSDKVEKLICINNKLAEFDKSGRRKPSPIKDSEFTIEVDTIIPCIGQELSMGLDFGDVELGKNGLVKVDQYTYMTNVKGIFAGGDALNPDTVVAAVGHGKKAAQAIDKYFGYNGDFEFLERHVVPTEYNEDDYLKVERTKENLSRVDKRIHSNTMEVNTGWDIDTCINEAKRCLHCDREQK